MNRKKYINARTKFIVIFGIFMLVVGLFCAVYGGITTKLEHDNATAVTKGKVVHEAMVPDDDGNEVRRVYISYDLPGQEGWLVNYASDTLEVGEEVNVHYNPDNLDEKYIEGFEDNPFYYVFLGGMGALLGVAALVAAFFINRHPNLNKIVDAVDRDIR